MPEMSTNKDKKLTQLKISREVKRINTTAALPRALRCITQYIKIKDYLMVPTRRSALSWMAQTNVNSLRELTYFFRSAPIYLLTLSRSLVKKNNLKEDSARNFMQPKDII
ncbi:hypothetical protein MS3_00007677 [Schistosoma haematobium]|uniref:Uncharacterized protein n=1 Tax=Schistosoma haematobium TaxID=6185 RepID=A0A6A5D0X3_SCHHA|nr:hypothetical protein MS3_00007677 [Schistosoma haematobium]KAH9583185.1 hypothetical protein MS3_00007677 [Schistosoma haematobium]